MTVLFENSDSLEEYYAQVSGRLQDRLSGRMVFLEKCSARLKALRDLAETLEDAPLQSELAAHLAVAADEIETLGGLRAMTAGAPAPPVPESPARPVSLSPDAFPSREPAAPPRRTRKRGKPVDSEATSGEVPQVGEPESVAETEAPPVEALPLTGAAPMVDVLPGWDTYFSVSGAPLPGETLPGEPRAVGTATVESLVLTLEILGPDREWIWSMEGGSAVLGRHTSDGSVEPEIDLWPDLAVSRRHAAVTFRAGAFYLQDLHSANGTVVNASPALPGEDIELKDGDVIQLGESTIVTVRLVPAG